LVPLTSGIEFFPLLQKISGALPEAAVVPGQVYLVGGAVRDAARGKSSHDLDLIVAENALRLARHVADSLGWAYFTLDEDFGVGRVVCLAEGQERQVVDFVQMQGGSLQSDLENRDFTINAMAVDLADPGTLIDPLGGLGDLVNNRLKCCRPTSLVDDPVRTIRAVRMAASFNLAFTPETRQQIGPAVARLGFISAERQRDEFLKTLGAPGPSTSLRILDRFGILELLIPQVADLKGVTQSAPHIYDVWEHSLHTVQALEVILALLDENYVHDNDAGGDLFSGLLSQQIGRYRQQLTSHISQPVVPDRPYRPLLFLGALLHDLTKPRHRTVEPDGRIRFIGHENTGAQEIVTVGTALRLSRAEIQRLVRVMQDHMRPWHLAQPGSRPTRRAIYRYWRDNQAAGVDVLLVALADTLGIFGHTLTKDVMVERFTIARYLLEAWYETPEVVSPPTLLDGHDLIEIFGLSPGPQLGDLLDLLREAQAAGEIETRQQALDFLSTHLADL
jgi:hypothetical protein